MILCRKIQGISNRYFWCLYFFLFYHFNFFILLRSKEQKIDSGLNLWTEQKEKYVFEILSEITHIWERLESMLKQQNEDNWPDNSQNNEIIISQNLWQYQENLRMFMQIIHEISKKYNLRIANKNPFFIHLIISICD